MWIRSQDRRSLSNVNQVLISNTPDESKYYIYGFLERGRDILGVYSSEEKALKVLDEIRNELNDARYYEIENNGRGMYTLDTGVRVYTMPDDEDVEV